MKTFFAAVAASALALVAAAGPALAQSHDWHDGHAGAWHGGAHPGGHVEAFRGARPGAWHGDWHGRGWGGPVIGFGFGVPYGGYAYAPPPVYVAPDVNAYASAQPPITQDGQWYFCPSSNAYYPNVTSCAVPWQHGPA